MDRKRTKESGMDGLEKVRSESRKTKVSRKKQLRGLKPTEDERKLQMRETVLTEKLRPFFI